MISKKQNPDGRGFTLMEVMLATAIGAIVLIAIQSVFFGALNLRNRTQETIDKGAELQQAVDCIRRDLAALAGVNGTFKAGLQTNLGTVIPDAGVERSGPDFYTTTGSIDARSTLADIQCVGFGLSGMAGSGETRNLVRLVKRNLLSVQTETAESTLLLHDVESLDFEYYDGIAWSDSWDSTSTGTLPVAIRVHLALRPSGTEQPRNSRKLDFVVPVSLGVASSTETSGGSSS